jgi:tetratricopeptide (TPR) repeat protein
VQPLLNGWVCTAARAGVERLTERERATSTLLLQVADYYETVGEYMKAEPLYVEALEIKRQVVKQTAPDAQVRIDGQPNEVEILCESNRTDPRWRARGEMVQVMYQLGCLYKRLAQMAVNRQFERSEQICQHIADAFTVKAQLMFMECLVDSQSLHRLTFQLHGKSHWLAAVEMLVSVWLAKSEPETENAADFLGKAVEDLLQFESAGASHPATLRVMLTLANLHMEMSGYEKAESVLRMLVDGTRQLLGDCHVDTLQAIHRLGEAHEQLERDEEARAHFEEALRGRRAVLGPTHLDTLDTLESVGIVCRRMDANVEAEASFREALAGRRKAEALSESGDARTIRSSMLPRILNVMFNLAATLEDLGQDAEAAVLFEDELRGRLALHDLEEAASSSRALLRLLTRNKMSTATVVALCEEHGLPVEQESDSDSDSDSDEGIDLDQLRGNVKTARISLGASHADTLCAIHSLGEAYEQLEEHKQAKKSFEEALKGRRKALGPTHLHTLETMHSLADVYFCLDRGKKAEVLLREALAEVREALPDFAGVPHPKALAIMFGLAATLEHLDRPAEAAQLFEEEFRGRLAHHDLEEAEGTAKRLLQVLTKNEMSTATMVALCEKHGLPTVYSSSDDDATSSNSSDSCGEDGDRERRRSARRTMVGLFGQAKQHMLQLQANKASESPSWQVTKTCIAAFLRVLEECRQALEEHRHCLTDEQYGRYASALQLLDMQAESDQLQSLVEPQLEEPQAEDRQAQSIAELLHKAEQAQLQLLANETSAMPDPAVTKACQAAFKEAETELSTIPRAKSVELVESWDNATAETFPSVMFLRKGSVGNEDSDDDDDDL